jgi:hypothetical protein
MSGCSSSLQAKEAKMSLGDNLPAWQARIQCWKGGRTLRKILKINSLDAISWHLTTTFAARGMISRHREMICGQFVWGVGEK